MAEVSDILQRVYQNLVDAGCDDCIKEKCMRLVEAGQKSELLPILTKHRKCLLDNVHKGQKQIDCLDYLIYKLKNRE